MGEPPEDPDATVLRPPRSIPSRRWNPDDEESTVIRDTPTSMPHPGQSQPVIPAQQTNPDQRITPPQKPVPAQHQNPAQPQQSLSAHVQPSSIQQELNDDATVLRETPTTPTSVTSPSSITVPSGDPGSISTPASRNTDTGTTTPSWISGVPRVGGYARPVNRYVAPVEVVEQETPPINWKRMATLVVATVLVAVLAGWAYVTYLHHPAPPPETQISQSGGTGPRFARADQLVREYLQALSEGNTQLAMSLGATGTSNTSIITQEAYARSLQTHPITDIRVPNAPDNATSIEAHYRLGDQQVDTQIRVVRDSTGSWQLSHSTVEITLASPADDSMPIVLNGVVLTSNTVQLLPGHYTVTSGLPFIDYPADNSLTITNLEFDAQVQRSLTPMITEQGRTALIQAASAALNSCLAAKTLTPTGCPNQLGTNTPYDPSSVRWSLANDPFSNAPPALDSRDPSRGQMSVLLKFSVSFTYTDGSTNGEQNLNSVSASVSASLVVQSADQLQIAWAT